MTYDTTNRLTSVGSTTLGYDGAGELTWDGSNTNVYDGEGRLAWQYVGTNPNNYTNAEYYYNALGERVVRYNGATGQWEILYNDPWGNETEVNIGGVQRVDYLPPVAGRQYAMYFGGVTYFTHANALGSTGMITDQMGAPQQEVLYTPWGWDWTRAGAGGNYIDMRFAGTLPWDPQGPETYNHATPNRMMSPNYSRWMSPDPLGGDVTNPQSLNRYAYVMNNPCSLTDPFGLSPSDCSFNITIVDNGVMSPLEASAAQVRLRDLLAKAGVGVLFNQSQPDLTLTPSEVGPMSPWGFPTGEFGRTPGSVGTLYVNNIRAEVVPVGGTGSVGFAVGTVAAHEFTHTLFGSTLLGTGKGLNHEGGWDGQKLLTPGLIWEDPNKIHQACQKLHPNNPTSGSGGFAGGGGGSGANGLLFGGGGASPPGTIVVYDSTSFALVCTSMGGQEHCEFK